MIRLRERIVTPAAIDDAFTYTADFGNIQDWDPGVAESRKIGDDPVGWGTRFELLVAFGARRIPMVYTITDYVSPSRVVLVGEGAPLTAIDEITFAETSEGTVITYSAELTFKGILRFVAPLMGRAFRGVGRRAVEGLAAALEPGTSSSQAGGDPV
jgi:hypothetical protein